MPWRPAKESNWRVPPFSVLRPKPISVPVASKMEQATILSRARYPRPSDNPGSGYPDLLHVHCHGGDSTGRPVRERIWMTASDLLRFTNRTISGRLCDTVENAIYRLTQMTLVTNIRGEKAK